MIIWPNSLVHSLLDPPTIRDRRVNGWGSSEMRWDSSFSWFLPHYSNSLTLLLEPSKMMLVLVLLLCAVQYSEEGNGDTAEAGDKVLSVNACLDMVYYYRWTTYFGHGTTKNHSDSSTKPAANDLKGCVEQCEKHRDSWWQGVEWSHMGWWERESLPVYQEWCRPRRIETFCALQNCSRIFPSDLPN